ncbi:MAG: SAM-dependent DNA methyltransferase [Verrucomicrobia bacterium]|nr:SAM-dependent DNA methyltransferase [Verrucomicrobiota bacterium]
MAKPNNKTKNNRNESGLNFEAQLLYADKMRGHMDASEYKHVCLGLTFLKYISDTFEEKREQLLFGFSDPKSEWFIKDEAQRAEAAENRDEYLAANVFWLPPEARWHTIKAKAKSPKIGKVIDDAMGAIERAVYGQESNYTTWKLARMNLAIRGIDANLGPRNADSFRQDLHPNLKAEFVPVRKDPSNQPFNMSDWGGENLRQDVRWKFEMPPVNNANYAWIQHFIHHLSPVGVAVN